MTESLIGQPDYNRHIEPLLNSGDGGGNAPNRVWEIDRRNILRYCGIDARLEYEVAQLQMSEMGVEP
jgi:hypothetical protein